MEKETKRNRMNRKIRYALKMNGVDVRTMKEFKEHFDYQEIIGYLADKDHKLRDWLGDRGYEKERSEVARLADWVICQPKETKEERDARDRQLQAEICRIFQASVKEEDFVRWEDANAQNIKEDQIQQLAPDEEVLKHLARIARNQEEFEEILKKILHSFIYAQKM